MALSDHPMEPSGHGQAPDSLTPTPLPVAFEVVQGAGHQVTRTRGRMGQLLVAAAAFLVAAFGPDTLSAKRYQDQRGAAAAIDALKKTPHPPVMQRAQGKAVGRLFPNAKVRKERMAEILGKKEDVPSVSAQNLAPESATLSSDGMTFEAGGRKYSLVRVADRGGVYVLAGYNYSQEVTFGKDVGHIVSPLIIGGANAREDADQQELRMEADAFARENLAREFSRTVKPVRFIIVSGRKRIEHMMPREKAGMP